MPLTTMLSVNRTQAKFQCSSKKRILENLAELIASSVPELNSDELLQQFVNRERLGSTGLGNGIAIPHCRFNTGGSSICALVTLDEGIDFDAVDDNPVDIVFAMLVPEDANDEHLNNLAALAEALQDSHYSQALRAANTTQSLFETALKPFQPQAPNASTG